MRGLAQARRIVVVTPDRYREMHEEDNPSCWCEPEVDVIDGVPLIVHNCIAEDTRWLRVEKKVDLRVARA